MNLAILLAAGFSTRAGQNKLWADVQGHPLWTLSHKTFLAHAQIDRICLVVPKGQELRFLPFISDDKTTVIAGGTTRMESFKRGLASFRPTTTADIILDHNAANPLVTSEEISAVIVNAKEHGAAAVAHPVVDTVAEVSDSSASSQVTENSKSSNWDIVSFRERTNLRLMQTPQAVRGDILQNVLNDLSPTATDLSSALLKHTQVAVIPAHPLNKKITLAEDIELLRAHLDGSGETFLGEDSHRFSNEGQLTLGGLTILDCPAVEANSDGDVILHAIGRALAQACGENFSELADPLSLSGDQDSRDYVEPLLEKCTVKHVSISVEGARPRIDPLVHALKTSLAKILHTSEDAIHISAHTGEDLTSFGRGEGLRCLALVTVLKL